MRTMTGFFHNGGVGDRTDRKTNRRLGYLQLEIRSPWEVIGSASP
jgi:hypothetical protein